MKHPYQVCDLCWRSRWGRGRQQPLRLRGDVREATPCAICAETTESGFYAQLADDEVRVKVAVVFRDGPREGFAGVNARMSARTLDTTDDDGIPIRYTLELIGGVLYARVSPWQREDDVRVEGLIRS